MGTQVCFTADDNLVSAIDDIARKIERSRSDTISTILWLAIQNIRSKQPKDFGELVQSVSGATSMTTPASFGVEREFKISNKDATDLTALKKQFKKTHAPSSVRQTSNAGGKC
jgi:metal-responsive CopG/Arc/MetJ family transcriptional regulator